MKFLSIFSFLIYKWMKVKIKLLATQSCLTLCEPMDYSLPGSSVHGILQARILEWVAIPLSRGSSWPRDWTTSPVFQADSLPSEPPGKPYKGIMKIFLIYKEVCIFVEKLEKGFYIIIWGTFFPRSLRFRNILGFFPPFLTFLKYIII